MERLEQWIVISPNSIIYQTWIFFISVLGVASPLFYVFCAAVRTDLETWPGDDGKDPNHVTKHAVSEDASHLTGEAAFLKYLGQIVFYTEMVFLLIG